MKKFGFNGNIFEKNWLRYIFQEVEKYTYIGFLLIILLPISLFLQKDIALFLIILFFYLAILLIFYSGLLYDKMIKDLYAEWLIPNLAPLEEDC